MSGSSSTPDARAGARSARWSRGRTILGVVLLAAVLGAGVACSKSDATSGNAGETADQPEAPRYGTEIRTARELGTLETRLGVDGAPVETAGAKCGSCHGDTVTGEPVSSVDELDEFHTDMSFSHGELSCTSCHAPDQSERDFLRKADGTLLAFEDTLELCAQCHGPQFRDYDNGAHGGMNGYWDLNKGPRVRNSCVNCHDPHDPAYPSVQPAPGPRDRFLNADHDSADEHSKHPEETTHE